MQPRPPLTVADLATIDDPDELLAIARDLEPQLRLNERTAALDRLEALLDQPQLDRTQLGQAPRDKALPDQASPTSQGSGLPSRWESELLAERAIDAAAQVRLDEGELLADRVLGSAHPDHAVALARATLAKGRALAWRGTEESSRQADRVLAEAAELFRELGLREWQGFTIYWRGYAVHFQNGDIPRAVELMAEALDVMGPDSPRRATILSFYADALLELGEWDGTAAALAEGAELADRHENLKARAYTAWTLARMASYRGDPYTTERLLLEVERDATDWFDTHIGLAFLTDAAEYLDRVGLAEQAAEYLRRSRERVPDDESIRQAHATMLARSGDPEVALDALQELVRGDWLEKRLTWRNTLMTAWATFRAGRSGAGELAWRAFDQAIAGGSIMIALAGEHDVTLALAPLAHRAGSTAARELLLDGRQLLISVFGTPRVVRADGQDLPLPAGKPGELVRMLAVHEHGMQVDAVCDVFFPEAPPSVARQRLRQILTRLRAASGELVVRDGDSLRLVPAWVDLREFIAAADRARAAHGARSVQKAYAALALWSGPLLPDDLYAQWSEDVRRQAEYKHLELLEKIVQDAAVRGSHQEALTALEAARQADVYDLRYQQAIVSHLLAMGQNATATYLADRIGIEVPDGPLADATPKGL